MNERTRQSLKAWAVEWKDIEAKRKDAEEKPLRDAQRKFEESARRLAEGTRELIQTGKDPGLFVSPAVQGKRMEYEEARQFNAKEAAKFARQVPGLPQSDRDKIIDYLTAHKISIADAATYRAAYERLKLFGLLEPEQAKPEPASEPEPLENLPAATATEQPEAETGVDPATGLPRAYSKREINAMSSEDYRRCFGLYGDRSPRVRDMRDAR